MKKTTALVALLIVLLAALVLPASSQDLLQNDVYDLDRMTGQHDRGNLIDIDGDGDMDFLVGAGTNNPRLRVFINSTTSMDSVYVLDDYSDEFGISGLDEVTISDFDNDGDEDVVVEVQGHSILFLHENLGNGIFADRKSIVSSTARNLISADVDGDGLQDLVMGTFNPDNLQWSKNLGGLEFDTPALLIEEDASLNLNRITDIRAVDIEGDGDDDLIIIWQGVTASVGIPFLATNDGTGSFTTRQLTELPNVVSSYAIEDFNGDGYLDFGLAQIISSGTIRGRADIYWNDQANAFPTNTNIRQYPLLSNGTLPHNIAGFYAFDIDNDSDIDIITGETFQSTYGTAELQLNDGIGNFSNQGNIIENTLFSGFDFGNGLFIPEVFVNDLNDDGRNDILTMTSADRDIILHTQNSDGSFNSDQYLNHSLEALNRIQFLDVNGDSFEDVIAIDANQNGKITASFGDGNGNFNEQAVLYDSIPFFPDDAIVTDLDENGEWDILFANSKNLVWKRDFLVLDEAASNLFTSDPSSVGSGRIGITNFTSNSFDVVDVDNDNDPDIILIEAKGSTSDNAYFFENNADGTFTSQLINTANNDDGSLLSYTLTDLDDDGDLDFISAELVNGPSQTYNINIHSYDAMMGSFSPTQTIEVTGHNLNHQFTTGDPDDDGDQDVIFSGLLWLENTGGTLAEEQFLIDASIQFVPVSEIITADINQDGLDDFITNKFVGGQTQRVVTIINEGNNEFNIDEDYIVEQIHNRQTFISADVDRDGVLDIISSDIDNESGSFKPVWLRTCFPTFSDTQVVSSCDSYLSPSGNYTWTTTGIHTDTLLNVLKCDSIITVDLTILESTTSALTEVACDSYEAPDGSVLTATGMYEVTIPNTVGCDSLISINLTLNTSSASNIVETACDSYTAPDGSVFDSTGLYDVTIPNKVGCDSLISIDLTINQSTSSSVSQSACEVYIAPDGVAYTTSGMYQATIQNTLGCDSLISINLTINEPTESSINEEACESYTAPDGAMYTTSGFYQATIPNTVGCDSLISINLSINESTESSIDEEACESYTAPDGALYTTSGFYQAIIPNTVGCDSLISINLSINESTESSIDEEACESYTAPDGISYTTSGFYQSTILNAAGCDSLININLTINEPTESSINEVACDSYTAPDGGIYSTSGMYQAIVPNTVGCDSLININLTINESTTSSISEIACESYEAPDGSFYTDSGTYEATILNTTGCDSLININLTVINIDPLVTSSDNVLTATQSGASYQWVNCDSNEQIDGATEQSFTPEVSGSFSVIIEQDGCEKISTCVDFELVLGLDVDTAYKLSVFPNPSTEKFNIEFNGEPFTGFYRVVDLSGTVVVNGQLKNESSLDLNFNSSRGVYYLQLTNLQKKSSIIKLIKQ